MGELQGCYAKWNKTEKDNTERSFLLVESKQTNKPSSSIQRRLILSETWQGDKKNRDTFISIITGYIILLKYILHSSKMMHY